MSAGTAAGLTRLIGRQREVVALAERICHTSVRLLTLTGPGGVGKTRLALAVLPQALETFEHGAAFVDLSATLEPDHVLPAIVQALGIAGEAGRAPDQTLVDHLGDQRFLLLLDNVEQVVDAAPRLVDLLLACPGLALLVTSRVPLRVYGEEEMPVTPLELPDRARPHELARVPAVALFLERAGAAQAGSVRDEAELRAVAELCRRLDGLPLAIELAAARTRLMAPSEMLARWLDGGRADEGAGAGRLDLLASAPRGAPARQRTLRDTIGWSYGLLAEPHRALFRRLSALPGGFTVRAAAALGGIGDAEAIAALEALVEGNLVAPAGSLAGETRFRMLATIAEYARERLVAEGEADDADGRAAAFCLELAERVEPALVGAEQGLWLDRIALEGDNMRAALGWLLRGGQAELAQRLAGALWRVWYSRGSLHEGRQLLTRALALDGASPAARAKALNALGNLASKHSDWPAAREAFEATVALRRAMDDRRGLASALGNLGWVVHQQGERQPARRLYEEALLFQHEVGYRHGIAFSLGNLGLLAHQHGDLAEAGTRYAESLALFREVGDEAGIALTDGYLANLARDRGDHAAARRLYEASLDRASAIGARRAEIAALLGLASLARAGGDAEGARARLEAAAAAAGELQDHAALAEIAERLRELDAPAVPKAARPLTAREREVAALVAQGLTSRAIAERLVLAERTVETHVEHILRKLDLRSRAQIAVWATQQGLVTPANLE